jgi:hypothetical protein
MDILEVEKILRNKSKPSPLRAQAAAAKYVATTEETDGQVWCARIMASMMELDRLMGADDGSAASREQITVMVGAACVCLAAVGLFTGTSLDGFFQAAATEPVGVFGEIADQLADTPYMHAYNEEGEPN